MHNLIRGSHMGTPAATPTTTTDNNKPKPHPSARSAATVGSGKGSGSGNVKRTAPGGPTPEQIARAKEKREAVLKQVRHEKRLMLVAAIAALTATPIWIIAVATSHWYHVTTDLTPPPPPFNNETDAAAAAPEEEQSSVVAQQISSTTTAGLFRWCRTTTTTPTTTKVDSPLDYCGYLSVFPSRDDLLNNNYPTQDQHVVDYVRTSLLFALVSLVVMVMSLLAAFYTFKNSRYMYKRLAAGLFFIAAACVLVVVEVVVTLVRYSSTNTLLFWKDPNPTHHDQQLLPLPHLTWWYGYGWSFYLGWVVFVTYLANGAIFLVLSRKHAHQNDRDANQFFGR